MRDIKIGGEYTLNEDMKELFYLRGDLNNGND